MRVRVRGGGVAVHERGGSELERDQARVAHAAGERGGAPWVGLELGVEVGVRGRGSGRGRVSAAVCLRVRVRVTVRGTVRVRARARARALVGVGVAVEVRVWGCGCGWGSGWSSGERARRHLLLAEGVDARHELVGVEHVHGQRVEEVVLARGRGRGRV